MNMIKSLWRTSHFLLAFVSSVFLLIASVTGGLLAVEPISKQTENHHITDLNEVSIAEFVLWVLFKVIYFYNGL